MDSRQPGHALGSLSDERREQEKGRRTCGLSAQVGRSDSGHGGSMSVFIANTTHNIRQRRR